MIRLKIKIKKILRRLSIFWWGRTGLRYFSVKYNNWGFMTGTDFYRSNAPRKGLRTRLVVLSRPNGYEKDPTFLKYPINIIVGLRSKFGQLFTIHIPYLIHILLIYIGLNQRASNLKQWYKSLNTNKDILDFWRNVFLVGVFILSIFTALFTLLYGTAITSILMFAFYLYINW